MAIPDYETLMRPVLEELAKGEKRIQDMLPDLARRFALTPDEISTMTPSGRATLLASRAHWARTYLAKGGLTESPRRGWHVATDAGRRLLVTHDGPINNAVIGSLSSAFEAWRVGRTQSGDNAADISAEIPVVAEANSASPPDEVMAVAHAILTRALTDELLDLARSFSSTPDRFEQLIVDLLIAMGYGGGDPSMGERLGKSGDGGIDGIVNEDRLGLDAVYLQAKCYAEGNTIGRPAIQQFIGSLTGEGATKGVFVTTSAFSKEARDYAEKVQQRIVLIDGSELARLMIQYGVGVRTRRTYEVKSVDEDYFAPPEGL